ncbi:MAG: hypothetical protein J6Q89_07780 [Clostridia bacterium]|nr:hypothetical protein [Clostridia bacterium]
MAMIKCPTCKKTLSDKDVQCPHCGSAINTAVICPKCNSKDTKVIIKDVYIASPMHKLLRTLRGKSEVDIKYICNNCGKKFTPKQEKER